MLIKIINFILKVQEIGDGLTKPVEKPIPKPLPPTVHLSSNNIATAKKPLEDKLKQLQPQLQSTSTSTSSSTTTTTSLSTYLSTKSSYVNNTNNEYNKRKKLFHLTNYPNRNQQRPVYKQQQQQSPSSIPYHINNPSIYLQPQPNYYQYNQNVYYHPYMNNNIQYVNNFQQQQQQQNNFSIHEQSIENSHIKLEPIEHSQEHQSQYFTNPIPFKQEPKEYNYENHHQTSTSSSSTGSGETNIVNNLLKDQQVLNLLEKVAEAFRPQTQSSMYQGSWNFH